MRSGELFEVEEEPWKDLGSLVMLEKSPGGVWRALEEPGKALENLVKLERSGRLWKAW